MPKYRKGMTVPEIAETIVATITQLGASGARLEVLGPAKFGRHDGFRMEIAYASDEGLEKRALVRGAAANDKLHLIVYSAPLLYYFDRNRVNAEAIMDSVRFLKAGSA